VPDKKSGSPRSGGKKNGRVLALPKKKKKGSEEPEGLESLVSVTLEKKPGECLGGKDNLSVAEREGESARMLGRRGKK